jgi:hypothetical protein
MSTPAVSNCLVRSSLLTFAAVAIVAVGERPGVAQAPQPVPSNPAANSAGVPVPPPALAPPAAAVSPTGSAPGPATGPGGGRAGAAEVTIVGGNVASARERALTEAIKQAVDQALNTVVPDARATQPKTVVQVLGRARSYIRRYRTVEEGERGRGLYGIRIEAEIDEAALQRAFDKPAAGAAAAGSADASNASYLVVGAGDPEAAAAASRAFTAAGARVQPARPDIAEPNKAVEAAARAGIASVAFVNGSATSEGKVRGPGVDATTCSISVRVLASGSGLAIAEERETVRGFGDRPESARASCFQRAASAAIPRVVPAAGSRSAPDVRTVVLDADVVEAGAVPALVKQFRGLGSVSAIEVRRIAAGRVEIWIRSRLSATALMAAVGRDSNGALLFTGIQVTGDLVRAQARLRENAPAVMAPDAPPAGAAAGGGGTVPDTAAAKAPVR